MVTTKAPNHRSVDFEQLRRVPQQTRNFPILHKCSPSGDSSLRTSKSRIRRAVRLTTLPRCEPCLFALRLLSAARLIRGGPGRCGERTRTFSPAVTRLSVSRFTGCGKDPGTQTSILSSVPPGTKRRSPPRERWGRVHAEDSAL